MPDSNNILSSERLLRLLRRATSRNTMLYLAVGGALIFTVIVAGREIEQNVDTIEAWIAQIGPWGILAFIGLFVMTTSFLVPDTVLCILAGALFDLPWGIAAVLVGNVLAAGLQFALAHKLLHAPIRRKLAKQPSLAAIQSAVMRDAFRLQVLLRLTPLNPATISYLLGAAGVRFAGFIVACLASSLNLMIEVYFGYAGKQAAMLAGGKAGAAHLHDLAIVGGVAACVVVMIFLSRMARKAVMQAVEESDHASGRQTPSE